MSHIHRVEVWPLPGEAQRDYLIADIAALGISAGPGGHSAVTGVERYALYFLHGEMTDPEIERLCTELLADPIVQRARWSPVGAPLAAPPQAIRVEVGLLPGVTDSVAGNLLARAQLLGVPGLQRAAAAQGYLIHGGPTEEMVHTIARRLLHNEVIQYYELGPLSPRLEDPLQVVIKAESVAVTALKDEELASLSRQRLLSLDLAEMRAVQRYFQQEGREPTDVELESIAQTWSEHCGHKTFKGIIDYTEVNGQEETQERIDGLIKTYLQAATQAIAAPRVRSAFVDNAGIVAFAEGYEVSFKVETHNHPSALEPFGGANTGVGGVVRDIIGVSARPIANTDVLCFGPLDMGMAQLPAGILHPKRVYNGVVAGIEDYGNKMGIPTVNGAIVFEAGYTANPLVYCGCVGIAPQDAHPRQAHPGDLIALLGGRTGRDGLHGATFSSIELTEKTAEASGGAVQIGNPITEKMVLDAILAARDEGLYTAITDCGAGGLSSAVAEMGEQTGVFVQLEKVLLKYHGLQPWEIWLSEAQERMVLAVPPEREARLREICRGYSVEMTIIGTFAQDGRLHLRHGDQVVADLTMDFLHHGIPCRQLVGRWERPVLPDWRHGQAQGGEELAQSLLAILAQPNVRSKEDVVRRYDHEVQGGTLVKPFVGPGETGPSDGAVLRPLDTATSWMGLALGCGFNPAYGAIDPYVMAVAAIDEAVRNVVAVGADPGRIAILDNFCWGNPLLPDRMGGLVRAAKGCYDGALHYGTPFISGKDSLNNEYTDSVTGQQVAIPGSLLVSAMGIVPDVRRTCTMDLKSAGDLLYILGETRPELGGSYYLRLKGAVGNVAPGLAVAGPATARVVHRAISQGLVRACHDCSEGGLGIALAEMALAGGLGAEIRLGALPTGGTEAARDEWLLFAESNGRYVLEVRAEDAGRLEALLADEVSPAVPWARLGSVAAQPAFTVWSSATVSPAAGRPPLFCLPVAQLRAAWRGHLEIGTVPQEAGE